jgi:bifunctional enzyme CysN/CysC
MATGASTADLAILLIDARQSVQVQTRRHAFIAELLGIRHVIVAINKMDLVEFSEDRFQQVRVDFASITEILKFDSVTFIPVSALDGDNITTHSQRMPWYSGQTLLDCLETIDATRPSAMGGFRLPVQWVNRPNLDFRGYCGTVAAGEVKPGDAIISLPSGQRSRVKRIVSFDGNLEKAENHQAITLTLDDEIDISRGDVICSVDDPAEQSDQFAAHVIWMSEKKMLPGRQYRFKTTNQTVLGSVSDLKYKVNVNTLVHEAGKTLELNEIGVCNLAFANPVIFSPYKVNRRLGSFIIIDRISNETVGAGVFDYSLRRAANVVWQDLEVDKAARSTQKHQRPCVLWFTGLSGSGKSTIANLVEKRLFDMGRHTYTLDGDNVRHGLNKDLGFTDADRVENIRRVSEVSKLMADSGLITLCAFISPFRAERQIARQTLPAGEFVEVYVNTPLEVAEQRDVKGLYAKARKGQIKNFTGIDSEYQPPENAEIEVNTVEMTAEESADVIVEYLKKNGYLDTVV